MDRTHSNPKKLAIVAVLVVGSLWTTSPEAARQERRTFTVEQILGFPSPENLVVSPVGTTIAWTFNERGARNIYAAEGPGFEARKLTSYTDDDGQEFTQLSFSNDGKTIVYVRGGDHGGRAGDAPPNPAGDPVQPRIQIWSVPVAGWNTEASRGRRQSGHRARQRAHRIHQRSPDLGRPHRRLKARAAGVFMREEQATHQTWSPDGQTLAFVSDRTDHSFIGLFTPGRPIRFVAPSTSRDTMPIWSPDGKRIAFLRQPGVGGTPQPPLKRIETPWSVLVADITATSTSVPAVTLLTSGTPIDPILQNPGGIGMRWAGNDTLVFLSYRDGFPHVYSLDRLASGGRPKLLTPGSFMVEQMTLSPDRRFVIYSANTGQDKDDLARRHLYKVPVDGSSPPVALTSGTGIEWGAAVTGDNQTVAFLAATAQRPPLPGVVPISGGSPRIVGLNRLPPDFPTTQLVTPEQVTFRASDGVEAHGQLFRPAGGAARKPAIVYIHGGGPRQMLLGWHNRWEYANDYGANQYLVSRGFIVLSVDYRSVSVMARRFSFRKTPACEGHLNIAMCSLPGDTCNRVPMSIETRSASGAPHLAAISRRLRSAATPMSSRLESMFME
jgi:Tol biopolymer transport system component